MGGHDDQVHAFSHGGVNDRFIWCADGYLLAHFAVGEPIGEIRPHKSIEPLAALLKNSFDFWVFGLRRDPIFLALRKWGLLDGDDMVNDDLALLPLRQVQCVAQPRG